MTTAPASKSVVALKDITLGYSNGADQVVLAQGLEVNVRASTLVAVSGRSGAGKTTLLRVAAGFLEPLRGAVWWDEQAITNWTPAARSRERGALIGFVEQGGGLIETLSAIENVMLPGVPTGEVNEGRARNLLDDLGVARRALDRPASLSGGEQQRVALARGLYGRPRALLVDEPTAHVDRTTADAIVKVLRGMAAGGGALLVASHDPHVLDAADDVIELEA